MPENRRWPVFVAGGRWKACRELFDSFSLKKFPTKSSRQQWRRVAYSLSIAPQALSYARTKIEGRTGWCVPWLLFGDLFVKLDCPVDLAAVGVALGQAADELEGAEGIEAEAFIPAQVLRLLIENGGLDGFEVALFLGAAGVKEEDLLARGNILGDLQHTLVVLGVIDAGRKADGVIAAQVGRGILDGIDQGDGVFLSDSIQQLFGVAVVLGIINNGSFHRLLLDFLWYINYTKDENDLQVRKNSILGTFHDTGRGL